MDDTKGKRDDDQATAEWLGLRPHQRTAERYGLPRQSYEEFARERLGDARSGHTERLGRPPGRDPFTGPYAAWDALDTPSDALLLIRKGGRIAAIDRNHVWEITADSDRMAVITCGHTIVTVEGRNLSRLGVDFFAGRAGFVMEFDPDKGHVMPDAAAPLVTKITSHPQERYRMEQAKGG